MIYQETNTKISARESIVAGLWIKFYTAAETAKLLNISRYTVESYRNRLKVRFGISNHSYHRNLTELINKLNKNSLFDSVVKSAEPYIYIKGKQNAN